MADSHTRRIGRCSRLLVSILLGSLGALFVGATAHADPAGPTDYLTEVVGIEPPVPGVQPDIVGGDSFFELHVDDGVEVFVLGYQDEDYLWFRSDGVVLENRNAPSTHLNGTRYGGGDIPSGATADAEPDWRQVSTGGSWVWHDHRAHWMQEARPVGFEPGDQILDSTIPLRVDGAPVDVRVVSTWLPAPSMMPVWIGAFFGLALTALGWRLRSAGVGAVAAIVPMAVAALVVGAWQYLSLPAATVPPVGWVALPVIAVVCSQIGLVVSRGRRSFASDAAVLVVGVELAIWGYIKRDGLTAAIIPTDAPMWLDRFVTALGLIGGVAFALCASWWLFTAGSTSGAPESASDFPVSDSPVSDSRGRTGSPRPVRP